MSGMPQWVLASDPCLESLKAKHLEQRTFIFGCVSACPVLLEVLAWPSALLESHGQEGGR